jgi:FkbM family methyltransferase
LDVPVRLSTLYTDNGYEPLSTAIFRSGSLVADVVVDVGAHIGYFSCLAANANPHARVIAVEASPENASVLSSNSLLNGFNLEVLNYAFGRAPGRVRFEITEASDNCGLSGHPISPTVDQIDIDAITGIDLGIAKNQRLLLKIDVEGHELSALQGLEQLVIDSAGVQILLEFNPKCILKAGQSPREIFEWLWGHDFRIFALDEEIYQWYEICDLGFVDEIGSAHVNLWCVPSASAMTVCTVMHSAGIGGAERSHVEVVQSLVGAGFMVHTILPMPDLGLNDLLHEVGSSTSLVASYPWWVVHKDNPAPGEARDNWQANLISQEIIEVLTAIDPEVVLTQSIVVPQGAIAALALGKPHVWWIREFADRDCDLQLPLPPLQTGQLVTKLSSKVLTNSAAVREYFFPSAPDMASVVYPIPRLGTQNNVRVPVTRPWTIGIVASLSPGKGHSDAFNALAELTKEGFNIRLACIGGGSNEDLERLNKLAEKLGIREKVIFTGQILNRSTIYDSIDALVITSRSEAFGRVAFEATDAGLPIIYPLSGGIIEYMVANETGLAYTSQDTQDLARAIKFLVTNTEVGDQLVLAARSHFHRFRENSANVNALADHLRASRSGGQQAAAKSLSFWLAKGWLERDSAVAERDSAVAERDSAMAERDSAVAERDSAVAERDSVFNSTTWKLFKAYRWLVSKI